VSIFDHLNAATVQLNPTVAGDRGPAQNLSLFPPDKNRWDLQTVHRQQVQQGLSQL